MKWEAVSKRKTFDGNDSEVSGYKIQLGMITLSVHRHIHYARDVWLCSCNPAFFRCKQLKSKETSLAQLEALNVLSDILERSYNAVRKEL